MAASLFPASRAPRLGAASSKRCPAQPARLAPPEACEDPGQRLSLPLRQRELRPTAGLRTLSVLSIERGATQCLKGGEAVVLKPHGHRFPVGEAAALGIGSARAQSVQQEVWGFERSLAALLYPAAAQLKLLRDKGFLRVRRLPQQFLLFIEASNFWN